MEKEEKELYNEETWQTLYLGQMMKVTINCDKYVPLIDLMRIALFTKEEHTV